MAEGGPPIIDETDKAFLTSTRLNRTAIRFGPIEEENWNCALCAVIDKRLKMIQCDSCDKWFHFRCVGLKTKFDNHNVWVCSPCTQYNEKYDQKAVCKSCKVADTHKVITCKRCRSTFHLSCARIHDQVVPTDWHCNTCARPTSVKTKSTTSSARARANQRIEMLTAIKELTDKKAADEADVAKKHINDQFERDLKFVLSKFDVMKDLDPNDDDADSASIQENDPHVELDRDIRAKNWIQQQNDVYLPSRKFLEFDNLSISSVTKHSQPILRNQQRTAMQQAHQNPPNSLSRLQIAARTSVNKDLPVFNGNIDDWLIFISSYENSTKLCGFSDVENLGRLQKCIKEPARKAVKHFLTFPSCVPRIIETLRLLYGNEEKIVGNLLEKIRKEPAPKLDDLASLVDYSLSVQNLYGTLEASKMDNIIKNTLLVQELANKLPSHIKLNWGVYKMNLQEATVKHLSEWLYELAKGACSVTTFNSKFNQDNESKVKQTNINVHQSSPEQSKSYGGKTTSESPHSEVKKCCLCPTKCHMLNDCPEFKAMSSEQRWMTVKNHRLCRFCLGPHFYKTCKQRSVCGINGCEYKHHTKLHQTFIATSKQSPEKSTDVPVLKPCNAHVKSSSLATLRYIVVRLYNEDKVLQIVAFLDEGATATMINRNIIDFLGIDANFKEDLLLKWTKGISRVEENSERISIEISGAAPNSKRYTLHNVSTVDDLELEKQSLDVKLLSSKYPYLKDIPAYSYSNTAAQMIIGLDNWKLGIPLKIVDKGWSEPVATKTRLGWEIHGEQIPKSSAMFNHHTGMLVCDKRDDELHDLVQDFFAMENFGVKALQNKLESKEAVRSKQILDSTMRNVGNRYEVGLLWRYDVIKLPDSFPMALNRFKNFCRQLRLNQKLAANVLEQMRSYVEKGYVQKLNKEEANIRTERTWYLPIFPRLYPKKPEKVRLVWDAAAKVGGVSLNSMLLQGPDNYANLVDILRRYRERKIPLLGDIKEWYHQIQVCEQDQESQRFLWPSDDPQEEFDTYKLKVLSFGATCSPSIATEVKERHALRYQEQSPRAVEAILENHYVDDWLDCFDTEEEAIRIGQEVKRIHAEAGFEIRNWISTSPNVINALDENGEHSAKSWNCDPSDRTERVLGMWWHVESDMFTFSLKYSPIDQQILTGERAPTKRQMLSILMSVYDPLGFLASFLVHAKVILQDTWRSSIGWDEQVSGELYQRWKDWVSMLPAIEDIRIPRHYSPKINANNEFTAQLHVFVDASELAFSAVAYLRIEDKIGVDVVLVGAKTKTAPLKPLSIPRLELQSFVLGVRFANSIIKSLVIPINRRCIWTDSSTVLRWLRSDHRKYNQFVGARVGEITEDSKSSEWLWLPGELNVADEATRWRGKPDLSTSGRWFNGPEFLRQDECKWPKPTFDFNVEPREEMRKSFLGSHTHQVFQRRWIDVNVDNISKYKTLVRVQIIVRRFIDKLMKRIRPVIDTVGSSIITREDYQRSEIELFQRAQYDKYKEEILTLQSGSEYVDRTSKIYQFSPYLDTDNVLRMKGRIDAAKCISFDTKRPIILPIDHRITQLLVMDYHEKFVHQNHSTVLNEIRQRFLIPGLTVFLKNVIPKLCQICKNKRAIPKPPQMADLPHARLEAFTRPFTFVGIDYAGPFYVNIFRRVVKRWIVLFTCLVVRAIHIEIASSLDTDSCIMCIRNFMNVRGRSQEVFSDRGTNLVGSDNELTKEIEKIDHDRLSQTFTSCYTKWNFNPPSSPHMGGVWERLVRSVKTTLYAVMPHRNPNDELLRCWLMEVMNIINSRPLTFVPIDHECDEALTPNHFLLGSSNGMNPPGIFTDEGLILRRNWRIAQQLADNFWRKWIVEYLPIIARRSKWFERVKPLEVGDIVLLVDEENIRNSWPKGKIIEVFEDKKTNQVRSVRVQTESGVYVRPVHKLAVLDVKSVGDVVESPLEPSTGGRMLKTAHSKVASTDNARR